MDNYKIADNVSMLSKLMDIHGENRFASKIYSIAAYNIEKNIVQLNDLTEEKNFLMQGIGSSVGKKL